MELAWVLMLEKKRVCVDFVDAVGGEDKQLPVGLRKESGACSGPCHWRRMNCKSIQSEEDELLVRMMKEQSIAGCGRRNCGSGMGGIQKIRGREVFFRLGRK